MPEKVDVVIVGSGFGGAVTACRLAEKGMKVLVLERGRRWEPEDYPRDLGDAWIWDQHEPHRQNGWIDLRFFEDMIVAQGAGVGGGSLIYANVVVEPKEEVFKQGWPSQITYQALRPYYNRVAQMLGLQTIPQGQVTERYKLMQDAADAIGANDRFRDLPLAVTFNDNWHYGLEDPFSERHSVSWENAQGQLQGTCIHCGNCDIGCRVRAKNTLDLNYLASAEKDGAEIRALHLVNCIEPTKDGYRVHFDKLEGGRKNKNFVDAERVVLAAGSIGSTEILLKCRDQFKTLPQLSRHLGHGWSSNGDFLTPAFYDDRRISPTQGPTITSAIDFLDGSVDSEQFFIEDGGFPNVVKNYLLEKVRNPPRDTSGKLIIRALRELWQGQDPLDNVMPWFAQGIDAADGRLYLGRRWYAPWRKQLKLDWDIDRSEKVIQAIVRMHERLSHATGGDPKIPPTWSVLKNLVTPHPLGGCRMGTTQANGVVDHKGQVFGYRGLYVADGAIVPEALGLNPSKTIAALAERTSEFIA